MKPSVVAKILRELSSAQWLHHPMNVKKIKFYFLLDGLSKTYKSVSPGILIVMLHNYSSNSAGVGSSQIKVELHFPS